jgi:hypothetical protein
MMISYGAGGSEELHSVATAIFINEFNLLLISDLALDTIKRVRLF